MWALGALLVAFFVWTLVVARATWGTWDVPQDPWSAWQAAQFVDHGWFAAMYRAMPTIPEFPVWPVLIAPVRAVAAMLHLTGGYDWYTAQAEPNMPTAWLLYGPTALIGAGTVLFAGNALALALGLDRRRRAWLVAGLAPLDFYVAVYWGHPEDLLATALLLYAVLALHRGRVAGAGWLAGFALATNPLVVLALPVALAGLTTTTWRRFALRAAVPLAALVLPPMLADPGSTWDALGLERNFTADHPTPLVHLAQRVGPGVIDAGPVRVVAVVVVVVVTFVLARQRPGLDHALWACGVALLARQLIEPVMNPYYLVPGLVALGVSVAGRPVRRALVFTAGAAAACGLATVRIHPWLYSACVLASSALCVWSTRVPPEATTRATPRPTRGPSTSRVGRKPLAVAGLCVLAVAVGCTVYSRSSGAAQDALLTGDWATGPGILANPPWGTPPVGNVANFLYFVRGGQAVQFPTLASFSFGVGPGAARTVRAWAASAEAVVRHWEQLAWVQPAADLSGPSPATSHVAAGSWIAAVAAAGAPGRAGWLAGPDFCPRDTSFTKSTLGAPDYRIVLWDGCHRAQNWLDEDSNVQLRSKGVTVEVGSPVDETYVVSDPPGGRLLRAYVGWRVVLSLRIAPAGQASYTHKETVLGVMELRSGPGGLRVWDPWWRYRLSFENVFAGS